MINSLFPTSLTGLITLFILSEICGQVFKIRNNSFYRIFHFTGGCLTFLFLFSMIPNTILCLILTEIVGVFWEIYEWIRWKYFGRKKIDRPQKKDTLEDLVLDFTGGVFALIFTLI
jgi:hypothetical protein